MAAPPAPARPGDGGQGRTGGCGGCPTAAPCGTGAGDGEGEISAGETKCPGRLKAGGRQRPRGSAGPGGRGAPARAPGTGIALIAASVLGSRLGTRSPKRLSMKRVCPEGAAREHQRCDPDPPGLQNINKLNVRGLL